jgi:hypothetical protein
MRWPEAVWLLLEFRFGKFYDEWNEGIEDDELDWVELRANGELDDNKIAAAIEEFVEDAQSSSVEF